MGRRGGKGGRRGGGREVKEGGREGREGGGERGRGGEGAVGRVGEGAQIHRDGVRNLEARSVLPGENAWHVCARVESLCVLLR